MNNLSTNLQKLPVKKWRRTIVLMLLLLTIRTGYGQINYLFPGTQAQTAPIPLVSGNNYPKAGDTAIVSNQAYINDFVNGTGLIESTWIKNMVTFRVNEAIPRVLSKPFTAVLTYKVFFTDKNGLTYDSVRTNLTLTINYDTAKASTYKTSNSLVFYKGYKVKVKVLTVSITDTSLLKALEVDNTIVYHNYYKFDCTNSAVQTLNVIPPVVGGGNIPDELVVNWASKTGVSGYDLEYTYIDSASLLNNVYGTPGTAAFYQAIFLNNASRVNLTDTFSNYAIPLLFEKQGGVYARIRTYQYAVDGTRMESDWKAYGSYGFSGHQTNLNWQSSVSFAEEGKRKAVVQYFDGSLRNRQTVTKDNTSRTTIVAENFYDGQGRAVIQVLPAPTLNTLIQYTPKFNSINNQEYDKTHYDRLIAGYTCGSGADSMSNNSGASKYYSPQNPEKNTGINQYIPNAFDYPFTETRYLADNTGRIASQGGVGKAFQIGNSHDTRYYYLNPDQTELDGLFGTEVGYASHYFKNMVRDANGQYSVSYVDMHGRTIATALAGNLPDSMKLDLLSEKKDSSLTKTITDSTNNIIKDQTTESSKNIVITKLETVSFNYTLPASTLTIKDCFGADVNYPCLYDLTITITDNCNNQTFGGQPYVFSLNNIPSASNVIFTKILQEGMYSVTKRLTINQASLENYRDSVFMKKNLCKSIDTLTKNFIDSFKVSHNGCGAPQDCVACLASVGTLPAFRTLLIQQNGWDPAAITAAMDSAITVEWNKQKANCNDLCPSQMNKIDQIYSDMLQDVNPNGGQYADSTKVDQWSIFNVVGPKYVYQLVTNPYKDLYGNPDTVYVDGIKTLPINLNKKDFVNNFKPSWANSLVTNHPEYARWTFMVAQVSKASFAWDNDFNNTNTFQAAYAKGYLNPTSNASYVNKFTSMSFPINSGLPVKDSFYIRNTAQKTIVENKMIRYGMVLNVDTVTIWGAASTSGYCIPNDNACYTQNKKFPFADTSSCKGSADVAWKAFKGLYSAAKDSVVQSFVLTNSTVSAALNTAFANGTHISRFQLNSVKKTTDSFPGFSSTVSQAAFVANKAAGQNYVKAQYRSNCAAYSAIWWSQLATCTTAKLQSDSSLIMNDLVNVCQKGSDISHPNGSSTISPDSTNDYLSFDDVIIRHVNQYNLAHPTDTISTISCNGNMILYPKAYSLPQPMMDKPVYSKPDSCDCSQINKIYGAYQMVSTNYTSFSNYVLRVFNTTISDSSLSSLLSRCTATPVTCTYLTTPIMLPPALQCGASNVCGTCDLILAANNDFKYTYPNLTPVNSETLTDSVQIATNLIYEQFMNSRLGLYRHTTDYMNFMPQCGIVTQGFADSLQQLLTGFSKSNAVAYAPRVDFNTQEGNIYHDLHLLTFNGVCHLPDSVRALPGNWYNNFQSTTFSNYCWDSGYSVEVREKFMTDIQPWTTQGDFSYFNVGDVGFVFDRYATPFNIGATVYPAGIYLVSFGKNDGITIYDGNYHLIDSNYNALVNWTTVKYTMIPTLHSLYWNGKLVYSFPRTPTAVVAKRYFIMGYLTRQGALDWAKLFDAAGNTKYFEDFNNPDIPSVPDRDYYCPPLATTCQQDFVSYFNTQRGKSYSYNQIDSVYMKALGIHPNVCGINPVDTCSQYTYQKTYSGTGADMFRDGHQNIDGGYIICGNTTSTGHGAMDGYMMRTDKKGNVLWAKTYGGAADDYFYKVKQTLDGGYIAVGTTKSFHQSQGEVFVTKVNGNGDIIWSRGLAHGTASGEQGYDIVSTPADSGYALVAIHNYAPAVADWEVVKLDKNGNVTWAQVFGNASSDVLGSILEDNDTLVIAGGSTYSTLYDGIIFKVNRANGNLIWAKMYDIDHLSNWGLTLAKSANGYRMNFLNSPNYAITNANNVVMDVDKNGKIRWVMKLPVPAPSPNVNWGTGYTTSDNGYVFAQGDASAAGNIYLHKLDSSGNILWTNRLKRPGNQLILQMLVNTDGTYTGFGYDGSKALLVKTDRFGKTGCSDTAYNLSAINVTDTITSNITLPNNYSITFSNISITQTALNVSPTRGIACSKDACVAPFNPTGPMLCPSNNGYPLPLLPASVPGVCSDSTKWAVRMATNYYAFYSDSVKGSFVNSYIGKCLKGAGTELLTMTQNISEYHYTLYYYDQAGNLVKTIPPSGVVRNYSSAWLTQVRQARANGTAQLSAHYLTTNYRYNTLNAVVAQFTPDTRKSSFWYDRLGRLVLSQNAKQFYEGTNYSYTLYDALGRIAEVGQINTGVGAVTTSTTKNAAQWQTWQTNNTTNRYQVTNTIYDLSAPGTIAPWLVQNTSTLRNRVSYSTITPGQKGVQPVYATYYNYDIAGNVSSLLQDFATGSPMGLSGQQYKRVDYYYDLISGKVNSVAYQQGKPDAFLHFYQYDAENRITEVYSSADSITVEHEAHYTYYKHGPLGRTLIGANQVQGVDYAYTLQGWLKAVNGTALNPVYDMGQDGNTAIQALQYIGRDAYGFSLHYYDSDYVAIASAGFLDSHKPKLVAAGAAYKGLFNGNISSMAVNIGVLNAPVLYNYSYDQLNRLTGMDMLRGTNTGQNLWTNGLTVTADYKERVVYDPNGNITNYLRNGFGATPVMDSMTYRYNLDAQGRLLNNRLDRIRDLVNGVNNSGNYPNDIDDEATGNYGYDSIGNLTKDVQFAVSAVNWSVYGKMLGLTKGANTITYQYDAAGNRIGKTSSGANTWYVRDAQGNILTVYSGSSMTMEERDIYGSSRLGTVGTPAVLALTSQFLDALGSGTLYDFTRGKKLFELTNHLGNELLTISDKKFGTPVGGIPSQVSFYTADVKTAQDYYPFGMEMPGRQFNATTYTYTFNGKRDDKDAEYGWQDYGMREYDRRRGQFISVDPLTKKYPWNSTYAFAENRVIDGNDLDGKEFKYYLDPNSVELKIKVVVNVKFSVEDNLRLNNKEIQAYQDAINQQFNRTLSLSSNSMVSGEVMFDKTIFVSKDQVVPQLTLFSQQPTTLKNGKKVLIGGATSFEYSSVNIIGIDGKLRSPKLVALDAVHELFHTLRLGHPFDLTQTLDTKLFNIGINSYVSDDKTDPNIKYNIMNYNMISIDGTKLKTAWKTKLPEYITTQQVSFLFSEIDNQQNGLGSFHKKNNDAYYTYWLNFPGTPVERKK